MFGCLDLIEGLGAPEAQVPERMRMCWHETTNVGEHQSVLCMMTLRVLLTWNEHSSMRSKSQAENSTIYCGEPTSEDGTESDSDYNTLKDNADSSCQMSWPGQN